MIVKKVIRVWNVNVEEEVLWETELKCSFQTPLDPILWDLIQKVFFQENAIFTFERF